jgi:hypothetical protein
VVYTRNLSIFFSFLPSFLHFPSLPSFPRALSSRKANREGRVEGVGENIKEGRKERRKEGRKEGRKGGRKGGKISRKEGRKEGRRGGGVIWCDHTVYTVVKGGKEGG